MDTQRVLYFCLVVEQKTIAKAAELVGMTPGALSRSIAALEAELGLLLFVSQGRNVEPSEAGRAFYRFAKKWLSDLDLQLKSHREKVAETFFIRIATFEVFSTHVFSSLMEKLPRNLSYHLLERTPGALETAVADGEADLGMTYLPIVRDDIEYTEVCSFRMNAYAKTGVFTGKKFDEIPFAVPTVFPSWNVHNAQTLDLWPSGLSRKVGVHAEQLETSLCLLRKGLCAVYIPEFIAKILISESEGLLQLVNLPLVTPQQERKVFLVSRRGTDKHSAFPLFKKALKSVLTS